MTDLRIRSSPSPLSVRVAAGALSVLFLALSLQAIWSLDLFWQIRTGQWILAHGWPSTDALSYTVPTHPWIELRWIFCVLAYWLWQAGGPVLLILLQTLMLGATLVMYIAGTGGAARSLPGLWILLCGILVLYQRFVPRPELFTYLFTAVFVVVLDGAVRGRRRRLLWLLPALQVLWVNSHTLFAFGPIVALTFLGADTVRRAVARAGFDRSLAASAALVVAACLVNPWGLQGATFPLLLFREIRPDHVMAQSIDELRSPFSAGAWTPDYTFGALLAAMGVVTFLLNRRRTDLARLALFAAHLYLAATSVRNLALFAFIGTWVALRNLQDIMDSGPVAARLRRLPLRVVQGAVWVTAALTLAGSWALLAERLRPPPGEPRTLNLKVYPYMMPEAPVRFLMQSGAHTQLFHTGYDAGYLTWAAHEKYPVFVDGRFEVYGEQFLREYVSFPAQDWDRFTRNYGIHVVLVNRKDVGAQASRLAARPDWVLVYLDDLHTLWVKDVPEHTDLIARYRIDPKARWTPRSAEPDERLPAWRKAIGARPRPWFSWGMAEQFMLLGAPDNAALYLERALEVREDDPNARFLLAQIERLRGNSARTEELTRGLRLSATEQARGDRLLGNLLAGAGRDAESVAPLERALAVFPDDGVLWGQLAWAKTATGDRAGAIAAYREALRRAPRLPDYHLNLGILLHQSGDVPGALASYREAARLDPERPNLWTQIGVIEKVLGNRAAARECFQNALRLRPDDPRARQELEKLEGG